MGRHREFDVNEALEAALLVFWEKGYQGTSFDDLTKATGVVRPGLYSAFGNKESLFRKALNLYDSKYTAYFGEALNEPTMGEVMQHVLDGAVNHLTFYPSSPGCMVMNATVAFSDDPTCIRDELIGRRNGAQQALQERFKRAQADGEFGPDVDCATLAGYVMSVLHGLAVLAKAGSKKAELSAIAHHVLSVWRVAA